jgi:hypothetical protein
LFQKETVGRERKADAPDKSTEFQNPKLGRVDREPG